MSATRSGVGWARMSPIFLRTWYQTLATSAGRDESLISKMICDSPGLL